LTGVIVIVGVFISLPVRSQSFKGFRYGIVRSLIKKYPGESIVELNKRFAIKGSRKLQNMQTPKKRPLFRPATPQELERLEILKGLKPFMDEAFENLVPKPQPQKKRGKNPFRIDVPMKNEHEKLEKESNAFEVAIPLLDHLSEDQQADDEKKKMETEHTAKNGTTRIIVITAIATVITVSLFALLFGLFSKKSPDLQGQNAEKPETQQKSEEQIRSEKRQIEREETFAKFQAYVDKHHPNWKVIGINEEDTKFYYLLLSNGSTERTIFVMMADFKSITGDKETHIYEPSRETLKNRKRDSIKESLRDEIRDEIIEEESDTRYYYDQ
jgi:hypothetical protein